MVFIFQYNIVQASILGSVLFTTFQAAILEITPFICSNVNKQKKKNGIPWQQRNGTSRSIDDVTKVLREPA